MFDRRSAITKGTAVLHGDRSARRDARAARPQRSPAGRTVLLAADDHGTYDTARPSPALTDHPDAANTADPDPRSIPTPADLADNHPLRDAVVAVESAIEAARVRPGGPGALRERVGLLERLGGLVTTGLADAIAALSACGGVDADGAPSTAEWLKANTGRSGRDANRVARLASNIDDLPGTRDALVAGHLSEEAADAVVQAARDGRLGAPDQVEDALLPVATVRSPEELRATIRDRQQAVDAAAMLRDENRQHARRSVRLWRRSSGMWRLSGELPDELGQTVRTALDAFDHPDPEDAPSVRRRRPDQRLADALAAMTGEVLDRGSAPGTGGIVRPHLSVAVQADTVSADLTDPSAPDRDHPTAAPAPDDPRWADLPTGRYPWGGTLSPQAVRRICCDAAVSRIVMAGESQVLDVGRATRNWSGPQRRAVNARDRGCRGPNCSRPIAWTAIHHLAWWRDGGRTSVDNGLALCHQCHGLVHDRGWTVGLDHDTAEATWTSPTGTVIRTRPHPLGTGPPPTTVGNGPRGPAPARSDPDLVVGPDRSDPPATAPAFAATPAPTGPGPTSPDPTGPGPTGRDPTGRDPSGRDPTGRNPTGPGP